ncbi:MAG: bifunctional lysine ketoglutarate reductase /saccharopine dehydrogenase family protein [Pseudomonadota bacterium]
MSRPLHSVGIRHEDKSSWERRAPLTPDHVRVLVSEHGLDVAVQTSPTRVFDDAAYRAAGARIVDNLDGIPVVLGVKEIPAEQLRPGVVYMYFAHVIKAQPYNMAMLRTLLEQGCSLMDYERITDDEGRRLVFFGRHAGLAGMIDTLWTLGQRLRHEGVVTPFAQVKRAYEYADLAEAKAAIAALGQQLQTQPVPQALQPLVFGFTGYGNVSRGAQEVFDVLPHVEVTPRQLHAGNLGGANRAQQLIKVVFKEEHLVRPVDASIRFALQDYYDNPERYVSDFAAYHDRLSVLVNCIYWDTPYPRLLTRADVQRLWQTPAPKLKVIGDISCDIEGSIEVTLKPSKVDHPAFVYRPEHDDVIDGVEGQGPVIMAVDNLPCELPADSSRSFGDALTPFVGALAQADYAVAIADLDLPDPLWRACIVHQGQLTPDYEYLQDALSSDA